MNQLCWSSSCSPCVEVEADERDHPEDDLRQRGGERERAGEPAGQRQQPDDERGNEREDDQRGRHRTVMKTTTRTAAAPAIASA